MNNKDWKSWAIAATIFAIILGMLWLHSLANAYFQKKRAQENEPVIALEEVTAAKLYEVKIKRFVTGTVYGYIDPADGSVCKVLYWQQGSATLGGLDCDGGAR